MSDVSEDRIKPSDLFTDVQVDLCGPISVIDPRKKTRQSIPDKSTWILLAICQYSRAQFLDVIEDYSIDSVLKRMRRMAAIHRLPTRIISDAGISWRRSMARNCPRRLYLPRRTTMLVELKQLKAKIEGSDMNHNVLLLTVQEIAKILNNRLLAIKNGGSLEHWRCITPSSLLGGQDSEPLCSWIQVRGSAPTKRLNYLQGKADEFWSAYRTDVLLKLLKAEKWNQKEEPLKVGDVVLVENQNLLERSFQPGRIISLEVREKGKKSRTAVCRFKLNARTGKRFFIT